MIEDCPVTGTVSKKIGCAGWIKTGFYRPKFGYEKNGVFYELASFNNNEEELLREINDVNSGVESGRPYFKKENFVYAHPFVFCGIDDNMCYETKYTDNNEIYFEINEDKITEIFGTSPALPDEFKVQYYKIDENSMSIYLLNYPVYNYSNYFFKPQIFTPEKIDLTISENPEELLYRTSQEIECGDTWIFYGNGSPLVTCGNIVLEKNDYELIYSYVNNSRKVIVKISENFLELNPLAEYVLHYNTNETILTSGYNIDLNTGEIVFTISIPENYFVYYHQMVQRATTFISEHTNWSFGHLRENPDIFFGEKDYAGDEDEDKDTGTPIYSGMKPTFVSSGYQIDYLRGSVEFTDGYKAIYKSEDTNLQYRDTSNPETFVRANYSYYPEIHGVFRQKMEMISEIDGYTFQTKNDLRYNGSIGKRWIMKYDNYQPMFFENFTDSVNVCSRYRTTAPNYDKLEKKKVLEVLGTDKDDDKTSKLTFILPLIESKFIVFTGFENTLNEVISFKNEKDEVLETFSLTSSNEVFYINDKELSQGEVLTIIGESVELRFAYLSSYTNSETNIKSISFELVSAKI